MNAADEIFFGEYRIKRRFTATVKMPKFRRDLLFSERALIKLFNMGGCVDLIGSDEIRMS